MTTGPIGPLSAAAPTPTPAPAAPTTSASKPLESLFLKGTKIGSATIDNVDALKVDDNGRSYFELKVKLADGTDKTYKVTTTEAEVLDFLKTGNAAKKTAADAWLTKLNTLIESMVDKPDVTAASFNKTDHSISLRHTDGTVKKFFLSDLGQNKIGEILAKDERSANQEIAENRAILQKDIQEKREELTKLEKNPKRNKTKIAAARAEIKKLKTQEESLKPFSTTKQLAETAQTISTKLAPIITREIGGIIPHPETAEGFVGRAVEDLKTKPKDVMSKNPELFSQFSTEQMDQFKPDNATSFILKDAIEASTDHVQLGKNLSVAISKLDANEIKKLDVSKLDNAQKAVFYSHLDYSYFDGSQFTALTNLKGFMPTKVPIDPQLVSARVKIKLEKEASTTPDDASVLSMDDPEATLLTSTPVGPVAGAAPNAEQISKETAARLCQIFTRLEQVPTGITGMFSQKKYLKQMDLSKVTDPTLLKDMLKGKIGEVPLLSADARTTLLSRLPAVPLEALTPSERSTIQGERLIASINVSNIDDIPFQTALYYAEVELTSYHAINEPQFTKLTTLLLKSDPMANNKLNALLPKLTDEQHVRVIQMIASRPNAVQVLSSANLDFSKLDKETIELDPSKFSLSATPAFAGSVELTKLLAKSPNIILTGAKQEWQTRIENMDFETPPLTDAEKNNIFQSLTNSNLFDFLPGDKQDILNTAVAAAPAPAPAAATTGIPGNFSDLLDDREYFDIQNSLEAMDPTTYQAAITQIAAHDGAVEILQNLSIDSTKLGVTTTIELSSDKFTSADDLVNLLANNHLIRLAGDKEDWRDLISNMDFNLATNVEKDNIYSALYHFDGADARALLDMLNPANYKELVDANAAMLLARAGAPASAAPTA